MALKRPSSNTIDKKIFPIPYKGGQTRMKKHLIPQIINYDFDVFLELFCGSAEISLELMKYYKELNTKKIFILNDIDEWIMYFHKLIKNKPNVLFRHLRRLKEYEFKALRDGGNYTPLDILNLWINSKYYCIRFNPNTGLFMNTYSQDFQVKLDKILLCHELYNYHTVYIHNEHYIDFFENNNIKADKVLVYLDPPVVKNIKGDMSIKFTNEDFIYFIETLDYDFILTTKLPINFLECVYREEIKNNRYLMVYKKFNKQFNGDINTVIDKDSSGIEIENINEELLTTSAFVSSVPIHKKI